MVLNVVKYILTTTSAIYGAVCISGITILSLLYYYNNNLPFYYYNLSAIIYTVYTRKYNVILEQVYLV